VGSSIRTFGTGATWIFTSIILDRYFHVPLLVIGMLFGINAIVGGLSQIYGGFLGDKYGLKRSIITFSGLATLGYLSQLISISFIRSGIVFASAFLVTNILVSLYQPSSNAILALSSKNTLGSFSYLRILTNLGWAIGPAAGGFLIDYYGFPSIYYISFGTSLLALMMYLFIVDVKQDNRLKKAELVLNDWTMISYGLGVLFLFILISQFSVTLSIYASVFISLNYSSIGFIYLTNGLVVVLFQWPVYLAIRRIGMWRGILLGNILYMIGYLSMGFDSNLESFIISMIVVTMGENFTTPTANTITSIIAKKGRMASYMGAFNFFSSIGRSIGPTFGSEVLSIVKNRILLWEILITPGFVSLGIFNYLKRKIKA